MSELAVELSLSATGGMVFRPGEKLAGVAKWTLDREVDAVEVRLIWFTKGKGTQDVQIVDRVKFDTPPQTGQRPFSFTLPEAPYSFSGGLISLIWALEIVARHCDASRNEFVLSPFAGEIDLTVATA